MTTKWDDIRNKMSPERRKRIHAEAQEELRALDESQDQKDDLTEEIRAAHPLRTGDHRTYARALELVSHRHSKQALTELVNYLLVKAKEKL